MKMIKAYPHINQGSEYIQISRLPLHQAVKFRNWISTNSFIKVKTEDQVIEDCVQFSEYEYWFDSFSAEMDRDPDFGI